jgi:hypothetical protein
MVSFRPVCSAYTNKGINNLVESEGGGLKSEIEIPNSKKLLNNIIGR